MASTFPLPFPLLATLTLLLLSSHCHAKSKSTTADSPASAPTNLTGILDNGGQFSTFIRLLTTTQVSDQIDNQLVNSNQGMTVLAPTDNAFSNLKPGTINKLSTQQQVQLILYHVLPKYYSLDSLQTVSNPVRTQASGQDGGVWGLSFTSLSSSQQVNVSTGVVETQVNNELWKEFPLAVYEVDKVLQPEELFGDKAIALAPLSPEEASPAATKGDSSGSSGAKGGAAASSLESTSGGGESLSTSGLGLGSVVGLWALIGYGLMY